MKIAACINKGNCAPPSSGHTETDGVSFTFVFFIKINLSVRGPFFPGFFVGFIFWSLKPFIYPKLPVKKSPNFSLKGFLGYSFIFALGTASLVSTDVLMVRSFFDPHTSGIYSSLSILGRMILFGLTPLSAIVLPIAAHRHAATGSARGVLVKLGSAILLFGLIGATIFSLAPILIIKILSGAAYLEAAPYLSVFAFTMVFFAISQFILGYLMAIGKAKANYILLIATLIQPPLIYLSRTSLPGVIWTNFSLQFVLVLGLLTFLISPMVDKANR